MQVRNSACEDRIPSAMLRAVADKVKKSSPAFILVRTDQVGIIENPPTPPPRFDAAPLAADRLGAFLLEDAPPLPDAFDPAPRDAPSEVARLAYEVLPLAFHFCFRGLAAGFLPAVCA